MPEPEKGLFRPEAIRAAAGSQFGEALQAHWQGTSYLTGLCAAVLGALLLFICIIDYAPSYRVNGIIDAENGLIRITSPTNGRLSTIAVHDGDVIAKGAILAVVSTDKQGSTGPARSAALSAALEKERGSVAREIGAARAEAASTRTQLAGRLRGLRAERATADADSAYARQLLGSLRAQAMQFASLSAEGYVSSLQLAQRRDAVAAQESRLAAAQGNVARLDRDIESTEMESRLVQTRLATIIENRQRSTGELDRIAVQNEGDAEQAIRAPSDGVISVALIAVGQSVATGSSLFTVKATDTRVALRLFVPPAAVGAARVKGPIKVMFRAYPRERFGTFDARIESVGSMSLMPSEIAQSVEITEPVFVAVAALERAPLGPHGEPLVLRPGMLVDAMLPIDRRSVAYWLFEPLVRGFNEGFSTTRKH